jgi:predicted dehydrogenase
MDRSSQFEVVGVIDRHAGIANEVARRRGYRHWAQTDRLDTVDWLDEVEAITVGAAPFSHYAIVSQALALGKHVLTEKPFTMTRDEGIELVEAAERTRLTLAIVHNFQFANSTTALLRDLNSGRLGALRSVTGTQLGNPRRRLPTWYDDLPLGLFYDESPHLLYLLDRLSGGTLSLSSLDIVQSTCGNKRTPAQIHVMFRGEGEATPFGLHCNFESPISEWYLLVLGDQCAGIIDLFRDIYIRLPNDVTHTTWPVLRTSLCATAQHWAQHFTSGIGHLTKRLTYGNDEVFDRFAAGIYGDAERLAPIAGEKALEILSLQHDVIDLARAKYGVGS